MRHKAVSLIVAAMALSLAVGCTGASSEGPINLVPQAAEFVGHINVAQILGDGDLIELYDVLPKDADNPQTVGAALADMKAQTGIDLNDFDELFIFGKAETGVDDIDYMGVIGKGDFDASSFINDIESAADVDLQPGTRGDYDIHVDPVAGVAVAFLDEETVVIGTANAVEDVLDVKLGEAPPNSGEVADIFGRLGNVLAGLAAVTDAETTGEAIQGATDALPIPIDLSALASLETAGFTFNRDGQSITVEVELSFADNSSAKDAKGLVSLVKAGVNTYGVPGEAPGGFEIPEIGQTLMPQVLAKLETAVDGSDLVISLTMTFEEIEQLLTEEDAL